MSEEQPTPEIQLVDRFIDPTRIHIVDIDSVRPNSWNPKDKDTKEYADVLQSIKTNGFKNFIPVRNNPVKVDEREVPYEIIDGEQRWASCKELGYTKICIYDEGEMDDKTAQELTLWWQVQVPWNDLSLAKMLTQMMEQYDSINVPFSEEKLEEMKRVANFTFDQYKDTPQMPPPPTADLLQNFMVQVTKDQFSVIRQALDKAIKESGKEDLTDPDALEFVCAAYIAEPETTQPASAETPQNS